jgi:Amt family ammonium transporter
MGVGAVVVYSAVMSAAVLWFTNVMVGLRVDDGAEATGLDVAQHREHMGT